MRLKSVDLCFFPLIYERWYFIQNIILLNSSISNTICPDITVARKFGSKILLSFFFGWGVTLWLFFSFGSFLTQSLFGLSVTPVAWTTSAGILYLSISHWKCHFHMNPYVGLLVSWSIRWWSVCHNFLYKRRKVTCFNKHIYHDLHWWITMGYMYISKYFRRRCISITNHFSQSLMFHHHACSTVPASLVDLSYI